MSKQISISFSEEIEPLFQQYCKVYKLSRSAAVTQLATEALLDKKLPPLRSNREQSEQNDNSAP